MACVGCHARMLCQQPLGPQHGSMVAAQQPEGSVQRHACCTTQQARSSYQAGTCSWREASVPGRTSSISRATCSSTSGTARLQHHSWAGPVQICRTRVRGPAIDGDPMVGARLEPLSVTPATAAWQEPHLEHVLQGFPVELLALHYVADGLRQPACVCKRGFGRRHLGSSANQGTDGGATGSMWSRRRVVLLRNFNLCHAAHINQQSTAPAAATEGTRPAGRRRRRRTTTAHSCSPPRAAAWA